MTNRSRPNRCSELNVGIICSCLPVVFPTLKGLTPRNVWAIVSRYVKTGRHRNGVSILDNIAEPKLLATDTSGGEKNGVVTFIRKAQYSESGDSINVTNGLHTFEEHGSIDECHYSRLLVKSEGSRTNRTQPSQNLFTTTG